MSRSMLAVRAIKKAFPFSRRAASLTRVPIAGKLAERLFFAGDDIMLLPRRIEVEEQIPEPRSTVVPASVLEHFVERAGFLWVMNECICRSSMHCRDYPVDLGCLFMGEAARGINPRLGREVTRAEALQHLAKCREAGLFHLIGRNRVDAVWLNVAPGERLLTVCNCCTCCCLWRMLPALSEDIASNLTRMPGLEVVVTDACEGCGTCLGAGCMVGAISVVDGRAVISEECRGCGRCLELCPNGAIRIEFEGGPSVAGAVARIEGKVDVS